MEKPTFFNKKSDWKVYSRRRQFLQKGLLKANEGKIRPEGIDVDDWHGLEDLQLDLNQFIDDSSFDNSMSETEGLECYEEETENEREKGEEAGLEGMRCLLGSQGREWDAQLIHDGARMEKLGELGNCLEINEKENSFLGKQVLIDNEQTFIQGQWLERTDVLGQSGEGKN